MKVADHKGSMIMYEEKNSSNTDNSSKQRLARTINDSDGEDHNTNYDQVRQESTDRQQRLGSMVI